MGFKFRRSMKIAPGLRINVTHKGVSARIGPRGAGYTINANGRQHISAGIPGSGIHVSEQIKPARRRRKAVEPTEVPGAKKPTFMENLLGLIGLVGLGWFAIWLFG